MPSRIGGPKAKVSIPKKSAKKSAEPLPHFGGKAKKSKAVATGAASNVSANRGSGSVVSGGGVSANRGVAPAETPTVSVSRGGSPSEGPVSGGRFNPAPVDTFNPGNVSRGRW